ncbi:exported hypothetical protein [Pseudomonas zeae]
MKTWSVPFLCFLCVPVSAMHNQNAHTLLLLMLSIWRLEGGAGTRRILTANCSKMT